MPRVIFFLCICLYVTACGSGGSEETATSQPSGESKHVIVDDAVINSGDVYAVIDPVWWSGDIYDDVKTYEASLSQFSTEQRQVYAIVWYIAEVNNGGHDQFFYNSTGIVWPDAKEALEIVGLKEFSRVLDKAAGRFSRPPSRDSDTREDQIYADEPVFDDLDTEFYELQERKNVDAALMRYIKKNRSAFYFDGNVVIPQ